MIRDPIPGAGAPLHVVAQLPRCSLAEALSEAERAMLAELGATAAPPSLRLVSRTSSDALPRYLAHFPVDQCTRRRRRALRQAARAALLPVHVLVALARWLTSACF